VHTCVRFWLTVLVTSATPFVVLLRRRSGAAALLTLTAIWPLMTLTRFAGGFSRRIRANRLQITFDADAARAVIHTPLH
jgi:hypothetical protein